MNRPTILLAVTTSVIFLLGAACTKPAMNNTNNGPAISNPPGALTVLPEAERNNRQARLVTTKGTIVVELFGSEAPIAVSNFITLIQKGFYNSLTFHRFEPGFVIQGGDPLGTGRGGPGYTFQDEPVTRGYTKGTVAMANAGPNTNGSQFFIMLEDTLSLPKDYTIFGQVTVGQDVVDQLRAGDVMTTVAIEPLGTP